MGLDVVAQDEPGAGVAGAGLAELAAEGGQGLGAPRGAERVEADEQFAVTGDDVAGGDEGFADERISLVASAGVTAVQRPGQGGFGVAGGHPDGVGDLLDLGLQADHVRGYLAKADAGGDYRRGVLGGLEFGPVGLDYSIAPGQACRAEIIAG